MDWDKSQILEYLLVFPWCISASSFFTCDEVILCSMALVLRSHLERGLAEFVGMKIWASSKSSPGFGRALRDSHIQIGRLAYIFRTTVGPSPSELVANSGRLSTQCSTNLPDFGLAPSGERHKFSRISTRWAGWGWMHVPWEGSYFWAGFGRGAREVQNCWKSSQLLNSTWKCDEEWAIPKFWQRPYQSLHEFTDSSWDLLVFLVTQATFTYSL